MTAESLLDQLNVSRETMERLRIFEDVIQKWNPKINLVSRKSLQDLWTRHITDSIQVFRSVTPAGHWVDLGSGGGFPGLLIAIIAADENPELEVTLIESDQRKSAFLRNAARECGARCNVISRRIEQADPQNANILSARALADLSLLLEFAERHLSIDGICLFPKGITWKKELEQAELKWSFDVEPITSLTEADAAILKIKGVTRV